MGRFGKIYTFVAALAFSFSKTKKPKRSLCAWRVEFSTHVTHYGPRPGFPYYNLTAPNERASYPPPGVRAGSTLSIEPWRPLRCADNRIEKCCRLLGPLVALTDLSATCNIRYKHEIFTPQIRNLYNK